VLAFLVELKDQVGPVRTDLANERLVDLADVVVAIRRRGGAADDIDREVTSLVDITVADGDVTIH
jgi:hypothetical protein